MICKGMARDSPAIDLATIPWSGELVILCGFLRQLQIDYIYIESISLSPMPADSAFRLSNLPTTALKSCLHVSTTSRKALPRRWRFISFVESPRFEMRVSHPH